MAWINGEEVPDSELFGTSSYEQFYENLNTRRRKYWEEADDLVLQPGYEHPVVVRDEFGVCEIQPGLPCPHVTQKYSTLPPVPCLRGAGRGTIHEGVGMCSIHRGNYGRFNAQGAILTAMAYADEMNVSPWEALLSQVRLLANQVHYLRQRIANAEGEFGVDAVKPGGMAWDWVVMLEARGDRLAKVAKMAIDAGVAERLVRQIELEADHMVTAALAMMDHLGIFGEQREEALELMGNKIMELEASENRTLSLPAQI